MLSLAVYLAAAVLCTSSPLDQSERYNQARVSSPITVTLCCTYLKYYTQKPCYINQKKFASCSNVGEASLLYLYQIPPWKRWCWSTITNLDMHKMFYPPCPLSLALKIKLNIKIK